MYRRIFDAFSKHKLASIIIIGIIIRVLLIPITSHPYDGYAWYSLSMDILKKPEFSSYNFPPLWYLYSMAPIAYTYDFLSKIIPSGTIPMSSLPSALNFYPSWGVESVPGPLFNSIVKFPFLISDILVAILLYKIVGELTRNKGLAEKAALLWFLNPLVIWISAGWGMWDSIPALLSLASLFFILKKKIALSAITLSLGVASKLYPILFVVPILIYILKAPSLSRDRRKVLLKFILIFSAVSLLLFLPYLGLITNFFTSYFTPNPTSSTTDPVVNPTGFGLTYWSLSLLDRLFNLQVSSILVSITQVAVIAIVIASLALVYWRTTKYTFDKPTLDLAVVMLFPILSLFFTYRIIPEQWFIWALPFMIILYTEGLVKQAFYWGTSLVALLYVFLNTPLPFFFLPLEPWHKNTLLAMVSFFLSNEPLRIVLLATLGVIFSGLLILIFLKIIRTQSS